MTPHDLKEFRDRMGWSQQQLANHLHISKSRIQDYERGWTRGPTPRRATIPYLIDLACATLERRHPRASNSAGRITYHEMTGAERRRWITAPPSPQHSKEPPPQVIGPMDDKRGGTITSVDLRAAGFRAMLRDLDALGRRYRDQAGEDVAELIREARRRVLQRIPQQVDVEAIRRGNRPRPRLVKPEPEKEP
jgi:hypothetical protein